MCGGCWTRYDTRGEADSPTMDSGEQDMPTSKLTKIREALVEYFDEKRKWRELKTEEYSHDTRNARSAKALQELVDYVAKLSDDDPLLTRLGKMPFAFNDDFEVFGMTGVDGQSTFDSLASQYGFHGSHIAAEFLADWVEAVEE